MGICLVKRMIDLHGLDEFGVIVFGVFTVGEREEIFYPCGF